MGFGVWALGRRRAAVVLLGDSCSPDRAGRRASGAGGRSPITDATGAVALVATGAIVALVCAWPTWGNLSGSVSVTQNIAGTGNPGNLSHPLRAVQALGVWLRGSYKLAPSGARGCCDPRADSGLADRVRVGLVRLIARASSRWPAGSC